MRQFVSDVKVTGRRGPVRALLHYDSEITMVDSILSRTLYRHRAMARTDSVVQS